MKKKKEVKFWNDTIQEIAKLRKPVVSNNEALEFLRWGGVCQLYRRKMETIPNNYK